MTKTLSGYEFKLVEEIKLQRDEKGEIISYNYRDKAKSEGKKFNTYGDKNFCKIKLNIPKGMQGLYALFIGDEFVYVGETHDLRARWSATGYGSISYGNSLKGGQTTNCMVNSYIYEKAAAGDTIKLYYCDHLSAERKIIQEENPKLNKMLNTINNENV